MSEIYMIDNAAFVHISKCGGTSIRAFCDEYLADRLTKVQIPDTVGHTTPFRTIGYCGDVKTFTFVRNPYEWIKSTWKYWTKYPNIRPDAMRALNNPFCFWGITFSKRLLDIIHEGDFQKTMEYWYHHDRYLIIDLYNAFTSGSTIIGQTESLLSGFYKAIEILTGRKIELPESELMYFPKMNQSNIEVPEINKNLLNEFYNVNKSLYKRFGYERS